MSALRKATAEDALTLTRVMDRINQLTQDDLDKVGAWDGLRELSSQTNLDMIDTGAENIALDNNGNFEATADVYVTLNYGPSNDGASFSDGYIATIRGHIAQDAVEIDGVSVDVSSFYE